MANRRSVGKLEAKVARNYCHQHSVHAGYHDPTSQKELVFVGTADEVRAEVLAVLGPSRSGEVPDCPQGLVLHSSVGSGEFD